MPVVLTLLGCTAVPTPAPVDLDGDGAVSAIDCDDDDPTRSPDLVEVPYDGIDNDCDGFDAIDLDADGYPGIPYTGQENWPPGIDLVAVDCADDPNGPLPPGADAAAIFPGLDDAPYDGIDADCAGDNDFDADGDGWTDADSASAFLAFLDFYYPDLPQGPTTWGPNGQGYAFVGDCDDSDPAIHPDAAERISTPIDENCDGDARFRRWNYGGYAYDAPNRPRLVRTTDHVVLAQTALWTSLADRTDPALAFVLDPVDGSELVVEVFHNVPQTPTFRHGAGLDLVADGSTFWLASTFYTPDMADPANDRAQLLLREYSQAGTTYVGDEATWVFDWTGLDADLDLQRDAQGGVWALACGASSYRAVSVATPLGLGAPPDLLAEGAVLHDATRCFQTLDGATPALHVCDGTGCDSLEPSQGALVDAAAQPYAGLANNDVDVHDGLLVTARDDGLYLGAPGTQTVLFPGRRVLDADAMSSNGVLYALAVLEDDLGDRTLELTWGDPTQPMDLQVFDTVDPDPAYTHAFAGCNPGVPGCAFGRNLNPERVSLHAGDGVVAFAWTGVSTDVNLGPIAGGMVLPQDSLAWMVLAE